MAADPRKAYRGLRRYIVILLCLAAAMPLAFIGGGIYYEYRKSIGEKVEAQLAASAVHHKEVIERFLTETSSAMKVITHLLPLKDLGRNEVLQKVLVTLQKEYEFAFEDMGVIDAKGNHLSYVGPYDLQDRNYAFAPWFKETLEKRIFISDVFLGFRHVPHFIIAVKQGEGEEAWILRATVNAVRFGHLVENVEFGRTGAGFILNREGVYQTRLRTGGNVLEKAGSDFIDLSPFEGVRFSQAERNGKRVLRVKTWLKEGEWILVLQQDADDAFAELYTTRNRAIMVFILGAILVGAVAFSTTALLVRKIEKADREKKLLDEQLIQSHKLASIGELSAGVAHEINNPLAVIGEEAGWLQDLLKRDPLGSFPERAEFESSLKEIGVQTGRCREITHKLLSFARKMESVLKEVDVNKLVDEALGMREREAELMNIAFIRDFLPELPRVLSDPSLLRQVILNLVNNAIDALPRGGEIHIQTRRLDAGTAPGLEADAVAVAVRDTGIGIPEENLGKIFDPFFTTKDPGKGTGLGLSICHGIVQKLGGSITVESRAGQGTTFCVHIPIVHKKGAS